MIMLGPQACVGKAVLSHCSDATQQPCMPWRQLIPALSFLNKQLHISSVLVQLAFGVQLQCLSKGSLQQP